MCVGKINVVKAKNIGFNQKNNISHNGSILKSTPTQSELQKWIRDEFDIDIDNNRSFSMKKSYHYSIVIRGDFDNIIQQESIPNRSYETCLEEALNCVLDKIQNENKK